MKSQLQTDLTQCRILVVDDQMISIRVLESILARAGFRNVQHTTDSRQVIEIFRAFQPHLLLLDLQMPHVDGFAVMEQVRAFLPANAYLPILILTANVDSETKQRALSSGADDFLPKPVDATECVLRINNLLHAQYVYSELRNSSQSLDESERGRSAAVEQAQIELIQRLAAAAEYRDNALEGHNERVGKWSKQLALAVGQTEAEAELLGLAAMLHDVGKIGLPDRVLHKAGKLTGEEFEIMKSHTYIGGQILKKSRLPVLQVAREVAVFHHERWDGTGYLQGHKGETIPLPARIVSIADAYDVMTNRRTGGQAMDHAKVISELRAQSGRQFDPYLLRVFLKMLA